MSVARSSMLGAPDMDFEKERGQVSQRVRQE